MGNYSLCFAFLRAINVGGHTVKKDLLCQPFLEEGLEQVEPFLASGNVIFRCPDREISALETILEKRMQAAYGFETAAFLRSLQETKELLHYAAFSEAEIQQAGAYNLAFLHNEPDAAAIERLMKFTSDTDKFHVYGRQVYWWCAIKQSQSTFSNAVLEKALRQSSTLRGMNTLQRMIEKYQKEEMQ